jgi:hypothetical protein
MNCPMMSAAEPEAHEHKPKRDNAKADCKRGASDRRQYREAAGPEA